MTVKRLSSVILILSAFLGTRLLNAADEDVIFNRDFFYNTPNHLVDFTPVDDQLSNCLRLIKVSSYRPGHLLRLVMDDELGRAVAYLVPFVEEK